MASVNRTTAAIETQLKAWKAKREKVKDKAAQELADIDSVIKSLEATLTSLNGGEQTGAAK